MSVGTNRSGSFPARCGDGDDDWGTASVFGFSEPDSDVVDGDCPIAGVASINANTNVSRLFSITRDPEAKILPRFVTVIAKTQSQFADGRVFPTGTAHHVVAP